MVVSTRAQAWAEADRIIHSDYEFDTARSARAGYDIYFSTLEGNYEWISDLGDRLEVNTNDGESVNIWIKPVPKYPEYAIEDALRVINDAIYEIDDKVNSDLAEETGIKEARNKLYGAYDEIKKILDRDYPESNLYRRYNLN